MSKRKEEHLEVQKEDYLISFKKNREA